MNHATIEKLVPGGQAIATLEDGKKAFIWGALPGETVEFEITKNKKSYCEGIATKILTKSPYRIEPKDECYLATSPWQIMDYDYELKQKSQLVKECFEQNHLENVEVKPTLTDGKQYGYRNKMEYSLYWDNETEKIYPAFHVRGTHRKIAITQSSIERPEIFQKAQEIIDDLNAKHAEARTYQALLIRANQQGTVSAALFENGKPHPIMTLLEDTLNSQKYTYSPNGFFQINLPVYELALKEIAQNIETNKVLDLYAGVGSIGLSVAKDKDLTLVEVNGAAYEEMQKNAQNIAPNATCILEKSENVTDYISPDCTVIVDPPRAGCDKHLIDRLLEIQPVKIVYMSCNPITQARDVAMLAEQYDLSPVQPLNFFPRTPHIESIITLTRKAK